MNLKIPPLPPPFGVGSHTGDVVGEGEESEAALVEGWSEFKAAYEADGEPINKTILAKQLIAALTPDERAAVLTAARGLIVWRGRQKKLNTKPSAQSFIRERDAWPTWAQHAPPPPVVRVKVEHGTRAWNGVAAILKIWGEEPKDEEPVEVLTDAIPALESLSGLLDIEWSVRLEETAHKRQVQAWVERLAKCGYKMPQWERCYTGEQHDLLGPVWVKGWIMPSLWPPRMDGTLSVAEGAVAGAGPPA